MNEIPAVAIRFEIIDVHDAGWFLGGDQNILEQQPFERLPGVLKLPGDFFKDPSAELENMAVLLYTKLTVGHWKRDVCYAQRSHAAQELRARVSEHRWTTSLMLLPDSIDRFLEAHFFLDDYVQKYWKFATRFSPLGVWDGQGDTIETFAHYQRVRLRALAKAERDKFAGLGEELVRAGLAREKRIIAAVNQTGKGDTNKYFRLGSSEALK